MQPAITPGAAAASEEIGLSSRSAKRATAPARAYADIDDDDVRINGVLSSLTIVYMEY